MEGLSETAVEKALSRNGAAARGRDKKGEEPLHMDMDMDIVDILGNITAFDSISFLFLMW